MTGYFAIETRALSKSYAGIESVKGLSLSVTRTGITGFLGRNGAGKSTTIKMLLGLIAPTSGDGSVLGRRITDREASRQMRCQVAYVADNKPLYEYMTVGQMIRFTRSFYRDWDSAAENRLLKETELPVKRKVKHLSKGMRAKLALLLAFARRPDLLILDEPSEGLDPMGIEQLLHNMMAQSAGGTAVFFSSHQIPEVERVANYVCILDKGRLMVDAPLDRLRQFYRRIELVFPSARLECQFRMTGVEKVLTRGHEMTVFASSNAEAVVARARELGAISVDLAPVGLRDIFLETVAEN